MTTPVATDRVTEFPWVRGPLPHPGHCARCNTQAPVEYLDLRAPGPGGWLYLCVNCVRKALDACDSVHRGDHLKVTGELRATQERNARLEANLADAVQKAAGLTAERDGAETELANARQQYEMLELRYRQLERSDQVTRQDVIAKLHIPQQKGGTP